MSSAAGGDFTREILHKRENTGTQTLVSKPLETKRPAKSMGPSFGVLTSLSHWGQWWFEAVHGDAIRRIPKCKNMFLGAR